MDRDTVDREYKNNLFCDLFSEKKNALSLYNALNHTEYTNVDDLEIVTLSDVIFMQQKNDVSIMFQNEIELWEHQSTLNYNMPLRGLIYFAHNIDGILKSKGITLYRKKVVKIPSPEYYVFYNGMEDAPECQDLKLSDSFIIPREGYEWTAHMLNINIGHNQKLLNLCPVLKGYALLIYYIREYQKEAGNLKSAVERAINRCIQEDLLKNYLLKKKAEVELMLLTEFNQEVYEQVIREESRAEGHKEGRKEGRAEGEERANRLHARLISEKRFDELERAVRDRQYQAKLYKEYGL